MNRFMQSSGKLPKWQRPNPGHEMGYFLTVREPGAQASFTFINLMGICQLIASYWLFMAEGRLPALGKA
jgi:hypothetical protein